jgi:hypothetical protein
VSGADQIDGDHEPTDLAVGQSGWPVPHLAVSFRSDTGCGGGRLGAGCPACPLPRCPDVPAAVAGVRSAGSPRASSVRQAAAGVRASGPRVPAGCVDLARVTSADEQA